MSALAPQMVRFTVNGQGVEVDAAGDVPLLAVLRGELGLTGSRFGCGLEQCGACTVLVDGEPAYACSRPAWSVADRSVATIEAAEHDLVLAALRRAFLDEQAGQCGYCLSGIILSARALLAREPSPDRPAIVAALDRHLCRCGAHNRIVRAVQRAAARLAEEVAP
ncbi:(2Fe-2S)-binding protein [Ancylobacter sp. Lp-2]|uniref:(2Fe-2S)-binding protein n=1 Tax=Ancylobacter sp. Lp-2 TaxID=2881339 RepID=UPI001E5BEB13|nr:(2Fe-2S)-binding protein [Ancylobacter sp. Lp-2]MCB4771298.1 (2Fe-2S)-binding protein [Ancylobacter sp. Lp-2]